MNTPGKSDGIMRGWVDGKLAFERKDVRLRDVDSLKIETVWLNVYYGGSWEAKLDYHLYIDDVVISPQYIGMREDESNVRRREHQLSIPAPKDSAGGLLVADATNDGKMDFLVTVPGNLTVFDNSGKEVWTKKVDIGVGGQSESQGLPGHDGPGVAVGDVDGDGRAEVIFLTRNDSTVHVVDGLTGTEEAKASPPVPKGAARWEQAMLADFRGTGGDSDILLQATNAKGYRTGRHLAAYQIDQFAQGWQSHVADRGFPVVCPQWSTPGRSRWRWSG